MSNTPRDPLSRQIVTPTLFGTIYGTPTTPPPAPAHARAKDTEIQAAQRIAHILTPLRAKTLRWVIEAGETGITAAEGGAKLAAERGLPPTDGTCRYSIAPRLTELSQHGLVKDSGARRGRAAVYVATDAGKGVTIE